MKYLLIVFFAFISFSIDAQTSEINSSKQTTLPFIDSLNYIDKNNLKQGFWAYSAPAYIGNCTNESIVFYSYFKDNKMQMEVMFLHDSNYCYSPQHLFRCKVFDDYEKIIFTLQNNTLIPILKNHFPEEKFKFKSTFNPLEFSKNLIIENLTKNKFLLWKEKISRRPTLTYQKKRLVGTYCIYENREPGKEFTVK